MELKDILFKEITESDLLKDRLIETITEENEVAVEKVPTSEEELRQSIIKYMRETGIELTQANYDHVLKMFKSNTDENNVLHQTVKKVTEINTLEKYSQEEMQELLQICILKQLEKLTMSKDEEYEYEVESVIDKSGGTDITQLTNTINFYAKRGWRVISVFTNELGKNSLSIAGAGINSTVDEVVVVFERRKRK